MGEVFLLWGCVCPSLRGCVSSPKAEHLLQLPGSATGAGVPADISQQGGIVSKSMSVRGILQARRQPSSAAWVCVGALARFGGSLQSSQNSRARAAQTAESRTMRSSSRAERAHLLANNSLHRSSRTLPRAPCPQQVRACSD